MMLSLSYRVLAAGTALCLLGATANAQQSAAKRDRVLVLDTLVVDVDEEVTGQPPSTGTIGQPPAAYSGGQVGKGSRLGMLGNRSFLTTPFNVTGYTSKLVENQQARSLADVVQNDPSVRNDAPPFSERDSFFIRGFSVPSLDTAYDGLFYIANPRRSYLDGIERIEILKGPTALLNGGVGRVGGTINLVPKRAFDEPLTRLTTSYMSDSQLWTHADLGRRFGSDKEWGVRVNGSYRKGDTALNEHEIEVGAASLGLDYRGERFRASFDLNYSAQNVTAPTSLFNAADKNIVIPRAPNGSFNAASSQEYNDSRYKMAAGRVEYDLLPDTTLYAAAGVSRYNEDFLTSSYSILKSNGDARSTIAIQPLELRGYSGEVGLRSKFQTGSIDHQFNVSASQAINENYSRGANPVTLPPPRNINIYNPRVSPWVGIDLSKYSNSKQQPIFADINLRSVAISDTLSLFDDRFELTLAGRYQQIASRGYFKQPPGKPIRYDEARFSPAIAAVWRPTEELSFYGNYVEALTEGPTAPATAKNSGDVFAPVVSRQAEVGVKYDFGSIAVAASLFEIRQPSAFTDPVTKIFSLAGLQVNRGAEFTVFGEPVDGVRLLGGVTFIDAELVDTVGGANDGNVAPGVPTTAINLYGEYDLPPSIVEGLTMTGRFVYTSSMFYDQANKQSVPSWTRVDAGLRYTFERASGKPVVLKVGVENLFDNAYWASAARGFLAVGAPRTFVASATFDF